MMKNMRRGIPNLFKEGTKHRTGLAEAVTKNLQAVSELANLTKTSLGPTGMNKMVINHLDKVFVTSDTATLMNEMDIVHPAAKMVVMAAQMQENELGDGSNLVICVAGALLKEAEELLQIGLHPSEIVVGYSQAAAQAELILETLCVSKITQQELFQPLYLAQVISAAIGAKQKGYEKLLSQLVSQAALSVMPKDNPYNFAVDNVRVVKILGGNLEQSEVIHGFVLSQDCLGVVKQVKQAKVAVFTCSIGAADTETKGTILLHNAKELLNYNDSEEKQIENIIRSLHDSGVRVIVTGSTVDDIAQHFLDKYKIMTIKTPSKFELRRVCKVTGARPLVALGPVRAEEVGYASQVFVREVGGSKVTVFAQDENDASNVATILLRASTTQILADMERAIDDGVNSVRALTRDSRLLAGAGACDIELARQLHDYAASTPGIEQYALERFALALEVIPRALAENSGHTALDLVSQLLAAHEKGASKAGLDLENGTIINDVTVVGDSHPYPIYDLYNVKRQAIKLAVDAALTVLRVDSIIVAKQAGGPKVDGGKGQNWDDDD